MSASLDLKKIERKAWLSFQQDGITDMFFGSLMVIFWFNITFLRSEDWIPRLMIFLPVLLFIIVKRFVVQPRMGMVKFGSRRKRNLLIAFFILLGSVLLNVLFFTLASVFSTDISGWVGKNWIPLIILAKVIIVLSLLAYLIDFPRLNYMMAAFVAAFIAGEFFDLWYVFAFAGAIVAIPGIILFVRFLRHYPLPQREEAHV